MQLLETLGRIAPKISVGENGVTPEELGDNLHDIRDQEDIQLVIYLFTHARIQGNPTASLDLEEHSDVLSQYEETITTLEELGWIERNQGTIKLTAEGVSIAGPAYSRMRNRDLSTGPKYAATHASEVDEQTHDANILIDDPGANGLQIEYSTATDTETDWEENYTEDDFHPSTGVSS